MRDMLEEKLACFEDLERQMSDPDVLANSQRLAAVARQHGALAKLATKYRRLKQLTEELAELRTMAESGETEELQPGGMIAVK